MCQGKWHAFLQDLPKCEHHMHLEGSLSPDLLLNLATRNNIALPSPVDDPAFASTEALLERYDRFTSLDDFLHYYFIGMSCLVHEQDFEQLAWEYFIKAKSHGVMHAEVFFDPEAHTGRGVPYTLVRNGFKKACIRAEKELGLSTELILCFLRHLPVDHAQDTFREAEEDFRSGLLAGIGLDSSEKGFPPGQWKDIYQKAEAAGIRRTAHAGEEGPVEYIQEALRELHIQRIDHGIKLAADKALMSEVARQKILVTMCPLSNVRLRCVTNIGELPIRTFLDAGVAFSINSDDPAYFGGYILENYCAVQESFGLSVTDWEQIARNTIVASWCQDERKHVLLEHLRAHLSNYSAM